MELQKKVNFSSPDTCMEATSSFSQGQNEPCLTGLETLVDHCSFNSSLCNIDQALVLSQRSASIDIV